jgi:phage shock protein C
VLAGVASGFGDYLGVDPVIVRLALILLAFLNGIGLIFYVVCWVIMPLREKEAGVQESSDSAPGDRVVQEVRSAGEKIVDGLGGSPGESGRGRIVAGAILIVVGIVFLFDRFSWLPWLNWARFADLWPLVLVALGIGMILRARRGTKA